MKITAVTQDQMIIIDGQSVRAPWCSYSMPAGEWAVHFDTETGAGEVEYIDNRPNEIISASTYVERYQHLEQVHSEAMAAYQADLAAQQAAQATEGGE